MMKILQYLVAPVIAGRQALVMDYCLVMIVVNEVEVVYWEEVIGVE